MTLPRRLETLEQHITAPGSMRLIPVEPLAFDSPADVLRVLAEQANAVRADAGAEPMDRARTLGFLSGVALKALEARDVVARLEAVERVLKLRKDAQKERDAKRK